MRHILRLSGKLHVSDPESSLPRDMNVVISESPHITASKCDQRL